MMWHNASASFALAGETIHVWRASFRACADCLHYLEATLSPGERARAARFRFDGPRERFIAARGVLRDVLARYVDQPAGALRFETNDYGKPSLPSYEWLHFNLSHSGDIVLIAVTRGRAIGIDVERIAPPETMVRLVEQFFSADENAAFHGLPESKRAAAFFAGWTRKEAYIKALGVGGSLPLNQFDVTLDSNAPARLLADRANPGNVDRWSLLDLDAGPGYAAALAAENPLGPVECYEWECSRIVE